MRMRAPAGGVTRFQCCPVIVLCTGTRLHGLLFLESLRVKERGGGSAPTHSPCDHATHATATAAACLQAAGPEKSPVVRSYDGSTF